MPELEEWRENGGITAPHDGDVPQEVLELQHGKPQPRKTGAEPGTVSRETPQPVQPRKTGPRPQDRSPVCAHRNGAAPPPGAASGVPQDHES